MGVAGETPTAVTRGLVGELKAKRQEEGEHELEKRLAIAQELQVGRFVVKLNDHQLKAGGFKNFRRT
jgi:hypothetical protein